MTRAAAAAGTTLVELLVATAVTLVALGAVLAIVLPWAGGMHALGEAADLQQRVRVAAFSLHQAIAHAGAGPLVGAGAGRPRPWPAVLPCRWAPMPAPCAPATDAITVLGMEDALQVIVADDMNGPGSPLVVAPPPGCLPAAAACRLAAGARAAIADGSGARDGITVTGVSADGTVVTHDPAVLSRSYPTGAVVALDRTESYYAIADPAQGGLVLRAVRGDGDFPLVDGLVGLRIDYFGDPLPPRIAGIEDGLPVVTYGPAPPPSDVDDPRDAWPAGENCTMTASTDGPLPRLAPLPIAEQGLARLPLSMFADGPWCPDGASTWRFDADLLRIRRVRVTLRFEARSAGARGSNPTFFNRPGTARAAGAAVPDMEVVVDVALRNPF